MFENGCKRFSSEMNFYMEIQQRKHDAKFDYCKLIYKKMSHLYKLCINVYNVCIFLYILGVKIGASQLLTHRSVPEPSGHRGLGALKAGRWRAQCGFLGDHGAWRHSFRYRKQPVKTSRESAFVSRYLMVFAERRAICKRLRIRLASRSL